MEENGIWSKKVGAKGLTVVALVSLLIGLGMSGGLDWFSSGRVINLWGQTSTPEVRTTAAAAQGLPDFVTLAKKLRPVVVNISTTQVSEGVQGFGSPFGEEDPFGDFWRKFFGGPIPRGPQRQKSLGSGFIIDRDGSILTNNHVVENAEKIVVKLADEREFEAKVIGKDSKTDIAVIKINAKGNFALPPWATRISSRSVNGSWP